MGFYSLSNGHVLKNFGLGSDLKQLEMLLASSWGSMTEQMLVLSTQAKRQKATACRKARELGQVEFPAYERLEIVSPRNNREYTHSI